MGTIIPVCSNKPRPSVQRGRGFYKTGEAIWGRDVFHADRGDGMTGCGIKAEGWLKMDPRSPRAMVEDKDCCKRCAAWVALNVG